MADSKSYPSPNSPSGKHVKAPNVFERAKEEFDAVVHNGKQKHEHHHHHHHHHHKETHGLRDDIDADSPLSSVKAPNVFERAKEEIEAIVEAMHPKKESKSHDSHLHEDPRNSAAKTSVKSEKTELHPEMKGKAAPSSTGKEVKEGIESPKQKPHHHKETHGRSGGIDEHTSLNEVKAPNVFERAKEEFEALIETIHPKKDSK